MTNHVDLDCIARLDDVRGHFLTSGGQLLALRGVTFPIRRGAVTGLVGETGSGKSVAARLLLGLTDENFRLTSGRVDLNGTDVLDLDRDGLRRIRGQVVSIVFQDAKSAFNPVFTVGEQLSRPLRSRRRTARADRATARSAAIEMLERVRIPEPATRARQYPHQYSGGMAQRAMIALGLVQRPELVVLDEPTTGLDVTIQADVLELLDHLITNDDLSALLITHDLGVVAQTCQWVAVMYAGECVEYGPAEQIFTAPAHPYTRELLRACRSVESDTGELVSIPGVVPDLHQPVQGCAFAERCPDATDICRSDPPRRVELSRRHVASCHLLGEATSRAGEVAS